MVMLVIEYLLTVATLPESLARSNRGQGGVLSY